MADFVHLHLHDEYSTLDGYGKASAYAKKAKELGFKYLGITNHGNIDGVIKFQGACEAAGIKPIIGCEGYIVPNLSIKEKKEYRGHITILVENQKGWLNLTNMLTKANTLGFHKRPRFDYDLVLDHNEGLIFMTGCALSFLTLPGSKKFLEDLIDAAPSRVLLEIMPHLLEGQEKINRTCLLLSRKYDLPLIATNDCHYIEEKDAKLQEVLLAIQSSAKWKDPDRWRFTIDGLHLRTEQEMKTAFRRQGVVGVSEFIAAISNTSAIAERCSSFRIEKKEVFLPQIPGYEGIDEKKRLLDLCEEGVKSKVISKGLDPAPYRKQMKEELDLINGLGFTRYFLIVEELIRWCRDNDILTGPGRGSVAGCIVAYLLGITQVDSIYFDLNFYRFISPARIDLPDIDMDFQDNKRHLVKKHLESLYGEKRVAGVSTFSTMKGRSAIRDVSRVFDLPMADVDIAAKAIVNRSGGDFRASFTIEDAFDTFEDGIKFKNKYPEIADMAMRLEGQVRGLGVHAAAVVVCEEDLHNTVKSHLRLDKDGNPIVNWEKEDAEYCGLMKLDILGLNALTVLSHTAKLVKKNYGIDIDYYSLPLDDLKVYKEFSLGNTVGVFQFGSLGLRKLCREIGVDNFNILVDTNALFRPGTLRTGMVTEFVLRKTGQKKYTYKHPFIEAMTKDTFGIILYQEQVMKFMYELGGLEWKTADTVRKVISKAKGVEQFMKFKDMFVDGCEKRKTLDRKTAGELWEELASFGCLTGDTVIYRVSSNQYRKRELTIKEAYNYQRSSNFKNRGLKILSMHHDGQVRYNTIERIYSTGRKEVFFIRTKSNKLIRASAEHRFLIGEAWKPVRDICTGDWIKTTELKLPNKIYTNGSGSGPHNKPSPIFSEGEGFTNDKKRQKDKLWNIYDGHCQVCGSQRFVEMHHIDGDRKDNTDENTMLLCRSCHRDNTDKALFKRFRVGYYTQYEQIIEIKSIGTRETYDIAMEGEPRNFVANGIISHNSYGFNRSHAVAYSLIAYYDMWSKIYYPAEFMAASLTYGSETRKEEVIEEAQRLGLFVFPPKAGISKASEWVVKEGKLYVPFDEIKGIGLKTSESIEKYCEDSAYNGLGNSEMKISSKMKSILDQAGVFDVNKEFTDDELEEISPLFSFSIIRDPMRRFRSLRELLRSSIDIKDIIQVSGKEIDIKNFYWYFGQMTEIKYGYRASIAKLKSKAESLGHADALGGVYGNFKDDTDFIMLVFDAKVYNRKKDIVEHCGGDFILAKARFTGRNQNLMCTEMYTAEELMSGNFDIEGLNIIRRGRRFRNSELSNCSACELRERCSKPVFPSSGAYNAMIAGEAPGKNEDEKGIGFIGRSGDVMWKGLGVHGLTRDMFHITNVNKCWPNELKTPSKKHVAACSSWLEEEIKETKPVVIFALGNTCMRFFKKVDSGIMDMNGKTEWNDKYGCWICWGIHPATVLYHGENQRLFNDAIDNFAGLFNRLKNNRALSD